MAPLLTTPSYAGCNAKGNDWAVGMRETMCERERFVFRHIELCVARALLLRLLAAACGTLRLAIHGRFRITWPSTYVGPRSRGIGVPVGPAIYEQTSTRTGCPSPATKGSRLLIGDEPSRGWLAVYS